MRRFYFQGQIKIDTVIKIENELFNHIVNVVKIKKDENFIIFNSESGNYFCVLKNIEKRFGEAKVLYKIPENEKNSSKISVYQCIPKGNILNEIIERNVELGVTEFTPIISERTIKRTKELKQRWFEIIKNSTEQCGRTDLMKINSPIMFNEIFNNDIQGKRLICYENSENLIDIANLKGFNDFHIILGPEGGFTLSEIERASEKGFESVSLGQNILKCLTANILVVGFISIFKS